MSEAVCLLTIGMRVCHLSSGYSGRVVQIDVQGAHVWLRHADGRRRAYPVEELRVYDPQTNEPTVWCRVSDER